MCSILGMAFFKGHQLKSESTITGLMSRLFKEAEVGGRSAAGLSIMREKNCHVLRRAMSGSELVNGDEYLDFMEDNLGASKVNDRLMSIIGHCRMPTQGSPKNNLNNHPLVIENIIGVHNGVIGNDHEIFESFKKIFTRKAEVDTEIIFQLINNFVKPNLAKTIDAIKKSTPYLSGSFACAMQNTKHPYNLYLFRHSTPINIRYYTKLGVLFFATRMHFIEQAVEHFLDKSGPYEDTELINDQGVVFNMWDRTMCKFNFMDKRAAEAKKHVG